MHERRVRGARDVREASHRERVDREGRLRVVLGGVHAEHRRVHDHLGLELRDAVEDDEALRHVEGGAREGRDLVAGLAQLAHQCLTELPPGAHDDDSQCHGGPTVAQAHAFGRMLGHG